MLENLAFSGNGVEILSHFGDLILPGGELIAKLLIFTQDFLQGDLQLMVLYI